MKEPAFYTWSSPAELQKIAENLNDVPEEDHYIKRYTAFSHFRGGHYRDFQDIEPNTSARSPYGRQDYEFFRGNESVPRTQRELLLWAMRVYKENGLVKNIVDLMGDFSCQGIRLVHPNKRIQAFYSNWWELVNGKDRTERIANMFFRAGTVIVSRKTGMLRAKERRTAFSEPDVDRVEMRDLPPMRKGEIPVEYVLRNPGALEIIGQELALFAGKVVYAIKVPHSLISRVQAIIRREKTTEVSVFERELVARIPPQIRDALLNDENLIVLSPEKTEAIYYKKDDWDLWGQPMIMALAKDIILLEKMKLADITALDGIISSVRLWKLGDLDKGIMPAQGAIRKLSNILRNNVSGGSYDLVWGPDIDFKESSSDSYKALGKEKYEPALNAIYAGLGIPPTLTGTSSESGFTNNFISLKTLIERLNYARDAITSFWNKEIAIVQRAMGFRFPAKVTFDHMTLSDESAEKALILQLWDRNIISNEAVLERFKEDPEIERVRVVGEFKQRDKEKMAGKSGPFFTGDKDHEYKKIFSQMGELAPEQLGLDLEEAEEDNIPARRREKIAEEERRTGDTSDNTQRNQTGRPQNSKDSNQRTRRNIKPRQTEPSPQQQVAKLLSYISWAEDCYSLVEGTIYKYAPLAIGKERMVELTSAEKSQVDDIKLAVLLKLTPYSVTSGEKIVEILKGGVKLSSNDRFLHKNLLNGVEDNRKISAADIRRSHCQAFGLIKISENTDGED